MIIKISFLVFITGLISCGNNKPTTPGPVIDKDSNKIIEAPPVNGPAGINKAIKKEDYEAGLSLINKTDCAGCHRASDKLVGPSYEEIANKYSIDPKTITTLVDKVINGGSGNWGQIPMQPHISMPKEDAEKIVKYILAFKKD